MTKSNLREGRRGDTGKHSSLVEEVPPTELMEESINCGGLVL